MKRENIIKAIIYTLTAIATALGIAFGLSSCQVSRVITSTAETHRRGDTCIVIQTKTTETFTGLKQDKINTNN